MKPCESLQKLVASWTSTQKDRFLSRILKKGTTKCWLWDGKPDAHGYGQTSFYKKKYKPHRLMLFLTTGDAGEQTCHICNNRLCCNPNHLYAGNAATNHKDAKRAGTLPDGEHTKQSKLKLHEVKRIISLAAHGHSQVELAKLFGVSRAAIYCILHGLTWTNYTHIETRQDGPIKGSKHPHAKVTEKQVLRMLSEYKQGSTVKKLAKKYGVRHSTISRILHGVRWAWLTNL